MHNLKRLAVALVASVVLVSGAGEAVYAAAPTASVSKTSIAKATVSATTVKYNGKKQAPKIVVKDADGNTLVAGTDYTTDATSYKNSGTYTITIKGIGRYEGTTKVTFTIKGTASKSANKVTAKAAKKTVKAKSVKKKAQKVKITVKKNKKFKGKVSYSVVKTPANAAKYIKVSSKGVVTFKKGAKKGTYKVKVSVAGYNGYNPQTKTVTIKVK